MYFSEAFGIDCELLTEYGAIDISLICDTPLFIDPMLIFNSTKEDYKELHKSIIKYLHFLAKKSKEQKLNKGDLKNLFTFNEVKENWLGYSLSGNCGSALGTQFAEFFAEHIPFVLDTHNITQSPHIEKAMLMYDHTGKDRLSDFTTNLIKGYLAQFTENFAIKYIDKNLCAKFPVDRSYFNYETESFVTEEFYLPYIINKNGRREYVLLTPADLLREDDAAINKEDLIRNYINIRNAIDNSVLKSQVENYISIAIRNYEQEQKKNGKKISEKEYIKIETAAFLNALKQWPELYDYYIKLKEDNPDIIISIAQEERDKIRDEYITRVNNFVNDFKTNNKIILEEYNAIDEARKRIEFFKNRIEYGGLYKDLYYNGTPIAKEGTLQRMFKLVWCRTNYDVNAEVNNGTGPVDFKVSFGKDNSNLVEFKLAKNSKLSHVLKQVASYNHSNQETKSLIVIFYFNTIELNKVNGFIKKYNLQGLLDKDIYLIDCRNDNKISASKI